MLLWPRVTFQRFKVPKLLDHYDEETNLSAHTHNSIALAKILGNETSCYPDYACSQGMTPSFVPMQDLFTSLYCRLGAMLSTQHQQHRLVNKSIFEWRLFWVELTRLNLVATIYEFAALNGVCCLHWIMLCWKNNELNSFQKRNNSSLCPIWYATPLYAATFCVVQLSASKWNGACIVLGGWCFVGRFGGGQLAASRVYVGGNWGNLWHSHWQLYAETLTKPRTEPM